MRKLAIATLLVILGTSATAMADRDYRRGGRDNDRRGYVQRDRGWNNSNYRRDVRRDYRRDYRRDVRRDYRRPVYVNNGRYTFNDGRYYSYRRPIINRRYTSYSYRPQILIENYDPMPGYIWVQGNWSWNGYEWIWTSGHYAVDTAYVW